MSEFVINGGKELKGTIHVNGAKNHALKMIAASLLIDGKVELTRVPDIEDVNRMLEIVDDLGVYVKKMGKGRWMLDSSKIQRSELHRTLAPKVRTSILLIGPLLARFGEAVLPYPGGCAIGRRPIDLFLKGYKSLGAKVEEREDTIRITANKLNGTDFIFPIVSHTATEAFMISSAVVPGRSTIKNAAMEPEVVALGEFLNKCGAKITGAGTPLITIHGVRRQNLRPRKCEIIPDRIEAGAFAAMAVATKSSITIKDCNPLHLEVPLLVLRQMGVPMNVGRDFIKIGKAENLRAFNLSTHEYPGFPTDLQAPFTVALTQARGQSLIHETIFEGRLFYVDKLNKMGANILICDPHRVLVTGPKKLKGTRIESPDIRAGMALVIAGLAAKGKTTIDNIYQIDRGHERIDERLKKLGADIRRN